MRDIDGNKVHVNQFYKILNKRNWDKYTNEEIDEYFRQVAFDMTDPSSPKHYVDVWCNLLFDEIEDGHYAYKFFAYLPDSILVARWGNSTFQFEVSAYYHLTGANYIDEDQFMFIYECYIRLLNAKDRLGENYTKYDLRTELEDGYKIVSSQGLTGDELRDCVINNLYRGVHVGREKSNSTYDSFLGKALNKMFN